MCDLARQSALLESVCIEAGELIMRHFGRIESWDTKSSRGDICTVADKAVEDLVITRLAEAFPGDDVLTEESGWVGASDGRPTWVLDPLDGTRNFAIGVQTFAVSLAYVVDGHPLLGAVYDPCHREMFRAQAGCGAYLNGQRIRVASEEHLRDCLVSVSWSPYRADKDVFVRTVERINEHTTWFRRIGSAALVMSYVANGRFDAYVQGGINPWDIAAGMLLVTEAGGLVSDFQGGPIDLFSDDINVLAANPHLHAQLLHEVMAP